jgi:protein SCO1
MAPSAAPATSVPPGAPQESARRGRPASRRGWLLLVAALVVLAAAATALVLALRPPTELPGIAREPAPRADGLVFVDHADPAGPSETGLVAPPGGLVLAYFGYLSCPDVCPLTMADIARAQQEIGPGLAGRTTVAFVTLDPARDDPDRLRSYLEFFFGDAARRALVAPDDAALATAAERLGVQYEVEAHAPGDERYEVAHSAITYVIDDQGAVVRELPFGTSAEDIARVLRALLA